MQTSFTKLMGIDYPIIIAPMFLVSNTKMIIAALNNGITAAIPALNFRTDEDFRKAIAEIKAASDKPMGVNLIVNKSNPKYKKQLKTCIDLKVDFIITSLGNPKEVITKCKAAGIKVFCDVVDLKFALKVADLGADAVIAVNSKAGGHSGNQPADRLVPMLKEKLEIPVISAGGIATGYQLKKALELGAEAVSIGTLFIASEEAGVSDDYKNALVEYGGKDIIMSSNISGTPLTVINTPYMQKLGKKKSTLLKMLNRNKRFKKYIKMLIMFKGMKSVKRAANKSTYKTVWVAGPSIEDIHSVKPVKEIIENLVKEYTEEN
ncbi:MAG: nitronate monooxygenase [Bacteroidetes bacterium]|nr:nitronate monooxygenase [Bacteroidota bacterium]MBL6942963.1 nitronate monooxygenase [Bacteroidales bacterium]